MKTMSWLVGFGLWALAGSTPARSWPDSSTGIVVFVDQLPGSLNVTQRWFAATKFAGTQKMLRSQIHALRVYNANFLCLHYQLALGCGAHNYIDGNAWTSDWWYVNAQTDWFLRNSQTQRVHQTIWNWDVMNILFSNSTPRTGFPQYWVTTCLARIRSAEDDGVFADSFTVDAYYGLACNPTHQWLNNVTQCSTGWVPNLNAYGAYIRSAFEADTNGYRFLPNLGALITSWDPTDYAANHGGMIEGFCFFDSWNPLEPADWELQMDRALTLIRTNKILICQCTPETWDYTNRMLATAGYLLIKGSNTYLNLLTTGDVALEYYPEYTLDLGGAIGGPPPQIGSLWNAAWGVYRRDYTNGIVLANPGAAPVSIAGLGTNYRLARATGGGAVNASADYAGALSYTTVTSLALPARSGAVLLYGTGGGASTGQWQASGAQAIHRSGQTFITWTESTNLVGESYRIYRHTAPIASSNLTQATRLYEVWEGSSRFYANYYNDSGWTPRYVERFVIANNGSQLPAGTGLLVWTLATNDFAGGATGAAYYAVTAVNAQGLENTNDFAATNSAGPVAEGVADPLPVEIRSFPPWQGEWGLGGTGHVYIQYMDLRNWNPTFHAPSERNGYYGFDNADPAVTNAIQYAYDYVVVAPNCPDSPAALCVNLHGWGGNSYGPVTNDPDAYNWCSYKIYPVDMNETWFYGFARRYDFRRGGAPTGEDEVVNYTEQRVLRMIYDTLRRPPGGNAVDTNRMYVYGHSMGGSGSLAFALRYPNVFAAANASQPMTDYATSGDGGGTDWRGDVEWKWGAVGQNLPARMDGPGGWADRLKGYNGIGVWDWQNHQGALSNRLADEMAPFGMGHGTNDTAIEWATQGQPAYPAAHAGRRCWGGQVTDADHTWMGFALPPIPIGPNSSLAPFQGFSVVRNESVPGLANAGGDGPLPPSAPAEYNHAIEWSASWYDWAGAPVDTPANYQLVLRSLAGNLAADVTPRRLQAFPHAPGTRVLWLNIALAGGTTGQVDTIAADGDGLITIANFAITTGGNRLVMWSDDRTDSDGDGLPDYWERVYFGGATNGSATADGDGDRVSNLNEYRAGTDPRNAASVFRISAYSGSQIAWLSVPGFGYRIEETGGLTNWPALLGVVTARTRQAQSGVTAPTNGMRFHRVGVNAGGR